MIDLKQELLRLTDALSAAGIDYALCGGLAVALHGYPRATKDIDLIIAQDAIESVRAIIDPMGFHIDAGRILFKQGTSEETTAWRISRAEGENLVTIDFFLVSPFLEDVWNERQEFEIDNSNTRLWAVSLKGLQKMKRSAGRALDLADLEKLE